MAADAPRARGEYAGFWPRAGAAVIDGLLLAIVNAAVGAVIVGLLGADSGPGGAVRWLQYALDAVYLVACWATTGRTLGDLVLGLRVVSADDDASTIAVGRAIWRYLGYSIGGVFLGLGWLWVIWDEEGQGWHDKLANTHVIRV